MPFINTDHQRILEPGWRAAVDWLRAKAARHHEDASQSPVGSVKDHHAGIADDFTTAAEHLEEAGVVLGITE